MAEPPVRLASKEREERLQGIKELSIIMSKEQTELEPNRLMENDYESDEEQAFFNNDHSRWLDKDYLMRMDEIVGMAEILNELCSSQNFGTLVFTDYILSVGEKLLANSTLSIQEMEGPVKQCWHIKVGFSEPLTQVYLLHHLKAQSHYVLVEIIYQEGGKIHWNIYDSLHTIQNLEETLSEKDRKKLLAVCGKFNSNFEDAKKQSSKVVHTGIQKDGTSCGFWIILLAIILIKRKKYDKRLANSLQKVTNVRELLYPIWSAWINAEPSKQEGIPKSYFEAIFKIITPSSHNNIFQDIGKSHAVLKPNWSGSGSGGAQDVRNNNILSIRTQQDPNEVIKSTEDGPEIQSLPEPLSLNFTPNDARAYLKEIPEIVAKMKIQKLQCTIDKVVLGEADLHRLQEGTWLNDEVINCFLKLYPFSARTQFIDSLHWEGLHEKCSQATVNEALLKEVKKYKFRIIDTEKILVAIHQKDHAHWIAGVVALHSHTITIYDSLCSETANYDWQFSIYASIFQTFRTWIAMIHKAQKLSINWDEWNMIHCPEGQASQSNTYDCGVFAIGNIILADRGGQNHLLNQSYIIVLRAQILKILLTSQKKAASIRKSSRNKIIEPAKQVTPVRKEKHKGGYYAYLPVNPLENPLNNNVMELLTSTEMSSLRKEEDIEGSRHEVGKDNEADSPLSSILDK
ncbi:hypothetical protein E1B28_000049 [Marasmius oreades]|uniref:Ubiquitin-like protease family profile domain-containing protein n=1 Tax=Marasmius oreades TaxID=181124 RepID=A0A9P7V0Q4_9AGAR|nr:uncharacterized protein E1B28_000049 [Marasmius oreades]KAG7098075.1 hypothetical protein E1B28_000049 [Marasmius oreades]